MTKRDELIRELKNYFTDDKRYPSTSWNSLADFILNRECRLDGPAISLALDSGRCGGEFNIEDEDSGQ